MKWTANHLARYDRNWDLALDPSQPSADCLGASVQRYMWGETHGPEYAVRGHNVAGYEAIVTDLGTFSTLRAGKRAAERWLRWRARQGVCVGT